MSLPNYIKILDGERKKCVDLKWNDPYVQQGSELSPIGVITTCLLVIMYIDYAMISIQAIVFQYSYNYLLSLTITMSKFLVCFYFTIIKIKDYKRCMDESLRFLLTLKSSYTLPPNSYFVIFDLILGLSPLPFSPELMKTLPRLVHFMIWFYFDTTLIFHCFPIIFFFKISELSFKDINLTLDSFNLKNMNEDMLKRTSKRYLELCNHMQDMSHCFGPIIFISQISLIINSILKHNFYVVSDYDGYFYLVSCLTTSIRGLIAFYWMGDVSEKSFKEAKRTMNSVRRIVSDHGERLSTGMIDSIRALMLTADVYDVRIAPYGYYTIKRENVKSAVWYFMTYLLFVTQIQNCLKMSSSENKKE